MQIPPKASTCRSSPSRPRRSRDCGKGFRDWVMVTRPQKIRGAERKTRLKSSWTLFRPAEVFRKFPNSGPLKTILFIVDLTPREYVFWDERF